MIRIPARRAAAALALAALVAASSACSSSEDAKSTSTTTSGEARYCAAWSDVVNAFEAFSELDVTADGTKGLQVAADDLEGAVKQLESAADDQITPSVKAFLTSVQDLVTTVFSPDLPVDRRDEVDQATAAVDDAWNEMIAALTVPCPDVKAPSA